MSTTKIIKGWVAPSMQLDTKDFGIIELLDHPAKYGDVTLPATLYIGPGKLWTEEEVRAMVEDIARHTYVLSEWKYGAAKRLLKEEYGLTL